MKTSKYNVVSFISIVFLAWFVPVSLVFGNVNDSIIYKIEHGSDYERKDAFLDLTQSFITIDLDSTKILLDSARNWISEDETELGLRLVSLLGSYYAHQGMHEKALLEYKKLLLKSAFLTKDIYLLQAYSKLGSIYVGIGKVDSASKYLNKGLLLANKLNSLGFKAQIYYDLAWVNIRKSINDSALENIQKAEGYYLELKDSLKLVNVYNAYFTFYKNKGDFETSLTYSNKAIAMAIASNNEYTLVNLYNNLGVAYWQLLQNYDSSRFYLLKANSMYDPNIKTSNHLLSNLVNLGGMEIQSEHPKKGLEYLNKALAIVYPLEDNYKICALTINIGLAYVQLNQVDSAKYYLNRGIHLADKIDAQVFMQNAYYGLYELDSIQGDYKSALNNYRYYQNIYDNIENENVKNRIAELEIIHETAEKEKDNQFLQNENQHKEELILKQRIVYSIIIISLILLLAFMGLLLRNKRKLKLLNEELKRKNTEVSEKNTIIKEKNDNLELQKEELITLNQTKDKFFSIISHDLRGPFNSLLGLLEILEEDFNDLNDAEKLKIIKRLHSNSRNTYNLLVNLLEWSRTQRGHITPDFLSIPLYNSAQSSITFLRQRINDKKHVIINKIDEDIRVIADVNLLLSVFTNLINNAVKFTPDGGNIIVSAKRIGVNVEMEINDNGIGIPEDQLDKLFSIDTSFSRKGTNDELGTGLGLLTCKEFVYLMNGTCRVESKEGKGTSFFIQLKSA